MLVIDDIADTNPIKKVATGYMTAYEKQFGSTARDLRRQHVRCRLAARSGRFPSRSRRRSPAPRRFASRCATRSSSEQRRRRLPGRVQHERRRNHNGMDERARVLVVVKDGKFRLLAQ